MSFRLDGFTRIRSKIELSRKRVDLSDVISGDPGRFPRGARLRFEFGLFYKDIIADPSNISASRLRLLSSSDPDSALGMDKTISSSAMNPGITQADWDTGEASKAHLIFEFTAVECAEGVFAGTLLDTDTQHWFLLTYGVGDDFLMSGTVLSFDGGYNPAAGTPPATSPGATVDQIQAIFSATLADVVRFKGNPAGATIELLAPTSGKKGKWGMDDDGNFFEDTQTTT